MPIATPVEVLELNWNATPPGLVGARPRRIKANTRFTITSPDDGVASIEFKDASPLANGSRTLRAGQTAVAAIVGRFKFNCRLIRPNGTELVLDPDDPKLVGGGGEMEILPEQG